MSNPGRRHSDTHVTLITQLRINYSTQHLLQHLLHFSSSLFFDINRQMYRFTSSFRCSCISTFSRNISFFPHLFFSPSIMPYPSYYFEKDLFRLVLPQSLLLASRKPSPGRAVLGLPRFLFLYSQPIPCRNPPSLLSALPTQFLSHRKVQRISFPRRSSLLSTFTFQSDAPVTDRM